MNENKLFIFEYTTGEYIVIIASSVIEARELVKQKYDFDFNDTSRKEKLLIYEIEPNNKRVIWLKNY